MTLAQQYAHGIYQARKETKADERTFFDAVLKALKRRHHEKLLSQIVAEYRKLLDRGAGQEVMVRYAREKDKHAAAAKAKELGAAHPHVRHDPSLISGYVVRGPDFRYDASGKKALVQLYEQLTAAR
jgi:F0F1-type ATP synthase delta subunit